LSTATKTQYTYSILRYRHDPLTGEFANVGVVVHAPSRRFLDAKARHTLGRLPRIFPDLNAEAFKTAVRSIERAIKRLASEADDLFAAFADAGAFAKKVLPDDDSSFIWGPIGSGLTSDPVDTLDKLYDRFVGRYDERAPYHRDDADVWKPVRDRLEQLNLADRLQAKTIRSSLDHVEFKHALKNGGWHCYQPISFDLANEENIREKARRWVGHMLALQDASEHFKPYFFIGLPSDRNLSSACDAARRILELSPGQPQIVEETMIETFIHGIEDQMRSHDGIRLIGGAPPAT
jgi:hypothetical protein